MLDRELENRVSAHLSVPCAPIPSQAGVKQGSKIMVLAIRPQSSPATPQTAEGSTEHAWDPTPAAEVWADQERHKKAGQGGQECRGPCPPPRSSGLDASLFIPRLRRRSWSPVDRRVAGSASQTGRSLWMTISPSSRPSSHRPGSRCVGMGSCEEGLLQGLLPSTLDRSSTSWPTVHKILPRAPSLPACQEHPSNAHGPRHSTPVARCG